MSSDTSERHLALVLLTLTAATGLIDAICYLGMGHVLVANMTGNVVFLGFALIGSNGLSTGAFVVALASFLLGAALGGRLGVALGTDRRRWLTAAMATQTALAATAAALAATGVLEPTDATHFAVIALLGIGTGVQNATVRQLSIPDLTTTVLTMTLTGLAADSTLASGNHPRTARRLVSAAAMLAGALIGGALMVNQGFTATLVALTAVLAGVTVGFRRWTPASTPQPLPAAR